MAAIAPKTPSVDRKMMTERERNARRRRAVSHFVLFAFIV
jgi:hypothetical protein